MRRTAPTPTCFGCGYDLRGLADSAVCPECGLPVDESRRRMPSISPGELRRLQYGAGMVLLCLVCFGLIGLALLARAMFGVRFASAEIPAIATACAGMVSWPVGWWLLASPYPSRAEQGDCRFGMRYIAAATVPFVAMAVGSLLSDATTALLPCSAPFLMLLIPGAWFAGFAYIAAIARHDLRAPTLRRLAILTNVAPPLAFGGAIATGVVGAMVLFVALCALGGGVLGVFIARAETLRGQSLGVV